LVLYNGCQAGLRHLLSAFYPQFQPGHRFFPKLDPIFLAGGQELDYARQYFTVAHFLKHKNTFELETIWF
jgi:hypothetical protein